MKDIKYITVMWRPYQSAQHHGETLTRNILMVWGTSTLNRIQTHVTSAQLMSWRREVFVI